MSEDQNSEHIRELGLEISLFSANIEEAFVDFGSAITSLADAVNDIFSPDTLQEIGRCLEEEHKILGDVTLQYCHGGKFPTINNKYERAQKLLAEYLTKEDENILNTKGYIKVVGNISGAAGYYYDISRYESAYGILLYNKNDVILCRFCVTIGDDYPNCDNLLAQKLYIENAEDKFISMANIRVLEKNREAVDIFYGMFCGDGEEYNEFIVEEIIDGN